MEREGMETKTQMGKIYFSPILLLIVMGVSIYIIEFLVMVVLMYVRLESELAHALLDSTILILMLSPILYFFLFRPVMEHVTEHRKMEEELFRAQKLESLGILAGGIAHDYNNLLTAIMANISLAKLGVDPESGAYKQNPEGAVLESLIDAERATLRAKELTTHLITFSKGGVPIKKPFSDIRGLIKESAGFALTGSNVKCDVSVPDGLYAVDINTGQINQVLQNIIINAKQAMPEGGLLEVSAGNTTIGAGESLHLGAGDYVRISITDHGTGITDKNLSRIFDPYFTTKDAGSGLGLATAYSIVKKHGGHILVDTKVGRGTTFTVYLPRTEKAAPEVEAKEPAPRKAARKAIGRVLIMDDEDLVRNTASRILSISGYEIDSARDGAEAIGMYRDAREAGKPYDAVIMDLTIPGAMGGKEAIVELKKIDPGVKAIVSSGYSDDPIMAECDSYGFVASVAKPYSIEELTGVVGRVAGGSQGH